MDAVVLTSCARALNTPIGYAVRHVESCQISWVSKGVAAGEEMSSCISSEEQTHEATRGSPRISIQMDIELHLAVAKVSFALRAVQQLPRSLLRPWNLVWLDISRREGSRPRRSLLKLISFKGPAAEAEGTFVQKASKVRCICSRLVTQPIAIVRASRRQRFVSLICRPVSESKVKLASRLSKLISSFRRTAAHR